MILGAWVGALGSIMSKLPREEWPGPEKRVLYRMG